MSETNMAPRSFSEDGAVGAASSTDTGNPGERWVTSNGGSAIPPAPSAIGGAGSTSSPARPGLGSKSTLGPGGFTEYGPLQARSGGPNAPMTMMFEDGGVVGSNADNGQDMSGALSQALASVKSSIDYGRQRHGLQTAANMPSVPASQSESGIPRDQPMPGALPPTNNPFGKRKQMVDNSPATPTQTQKPRIIQPSLPPYPGSPPGVKSRFNLAANMPSVPASQSESGIPREQPIPGALPPTNNPFGKRKQMVENDDSDQDDGQQGGAIPAQPADEETA